MSMRKAIHYALEVGPWLVLSQSRQERGLALQLQSLVATPRTASLLAPECFSNRVGQTRGQPHSAGNDS